MEGKIKHDGVLESYSPATSFEVRLNEVQQRSTKCPSSERAMSIFEVFDEVLPQLGIFQKVLKMVRDETFEAVYSHQYTGSQEQHTDYSPATNVMTAKGSENKVFIQRIPYFSLVQRVYDSRHEEAEELREEMKVLQKRLSDKTMQFNQAVTTIGVLRDDIGELQVTVEEKVEMINTRDETIARKEEEIITLKDEAFREKTQLEIEKQQLEEDVERLQSEVEYLSHYKTGYDNLEEAFIFRPGEDKFSHAPKKPRKSAIATKKNHLMTDYEAAKKIEKQLLLVRNQTIEEFDAFVESHVTELKDRVFKDKPSEDLILPDHVYDQEELIIERLDMELGGMQERFQQTIEALNNELDMIRLHKDYVETQLDELDKQIRAGAKPPSRVMFRSTGGNLNSAGARSNHSAGQYGKQSRLSGKDSTMSVAGGGDGFDNMDLMGAEMDPFIPQEAILSKYSIMVYTSTNQKKTFHGLKDAKFCASCGEKTVICPHKVSNEKVIILPHNCTHIKLSRPRVRIQAERKEKEYRKPHPPKSKKGAPPSAATDGSGMRKTKRMANQEVGTQEGEPEMERPEVTIRLPADDQTDEGGIGDEGGEKEDGEKEEGEKEGDEGDEEGDEKKAAAAQEHQEKPFTVLWDDYKERTGQTRHVPRPLELRRVMSMISQFYSYVLLQDDTAGTPAVSVLEALYTHLEERYLIREVSYLCMHDFIQGVIEYAPPHKFIQIFAHVMVGNLDATVFRYLLILTDLVDRVEWHHIEDFKYFIMVVYPFLNEDEIDQLHLGYTSFSENKVTKTLIFEYFMYVILKYREPRFQDVEMKMAQRPGREFGVMSEREFNEAADALAPLANEGMRHRLFTESLEHFSKDGRVAISRLTHIVSYLLLHGMAPLLREKICDTMQDHRLNSADSQSRANQSRGGMQSRGTNLSRTGQGMERPIATATTVLNQEKRDEEKIITASQLKNLGKNVERRSQNRNVRQIQGNPRMDMDDMLGNGDAINELAEFSNSGLLVIGPD